MIGYAKSDLVKLDMMLNGEVVDALSFIIHKDKAYARGRKMAEKSQQKIPRQLFEASDTGLYRRKICWRVRISKSGHEKMCLPNVMAVISAVNGNCWKNKKKVKNVCVN